MDHEDLGEKLFKLRDYTPIPLILLLILVAKPTVLSATVGVLLIVFGELIRLHAVAFIGSISRTRKDHTGSNLITNGPFGIVRNPLYVGNFFLVLGISAFSAKPWFIVLSIMLFAFQYYHIVQYEEDILRERFGAEYLTYKEQVPAFWPSKIPSLSTWQWPESYSAAIVSEKRTFAAIGGMLLVLLFIAKA